MRKFARLLPVVVLLACSSLASADIIFTLGNVPSGDVNILLSSGATGTLVTGTISGFPGFTVNFNSTQALLEPSSGQARVTANPEGTPLTNLMISLANNATFGDLIINPFVGGPGVCANCVSGNSTISVIGVKNGVVEPVATFTLPLGNGNNFLTIVAANGESILNVNIDAPGGFHDLRQPRISGPFTTPEPASIMLLGTGLLGLARLLRRRS